MSEGKKSSQKKKKKRKPLPTSRFVSDNSRLSIGIVLVSPQNPERLENNKIPETFPWDFSEGFSPGIFLRDFPLKLSYKVFLWNFSGDENSWNFIPDTKAPSTFFKSHLIVLACFS